MYTRWWLPIKTLPYTLWCTRERFSEVLYIETLVNVYFPKDGNYLNTKSNSRITRRSHITHPWISWIIAYMLNFDTPWPIYSLIQNWIFNSQCCFISNTIKCLLRVLGNTFFFIFSGYINLKFGSHTSWVFPLCKFECAPHNDDLNVTAHMRFIFNKNSKIWRKEKTKWWKIFDTIYFP